MGSLVKFKKKQIKNILTNFKIISTNLNILKLLNFYIVYKNILNNIYIYINMY